MHRFPSVALLILLFFVPAAFSQAKTQPFYYSRLNSFGFFGEYSNNSSHILLGVTQNRKLLDFGGFYSRRILLNHIVDGQYMAELRPVMIESDPLFHETTVVTSPPSIAGTYENDLTFAEACHPFSKTFTTVIEGMTYSSTETISCKHRQWTFGEGFSPIGFKANFLPRHRLQPVFTALAGYMFSTRPIPVVDAGSWNFTFEVGAGFELYRSARRSIRAEYLLHHISNDYTANTNPGIDSQMIQITYAFGH